VGEDVIVAAIGPHYSVFYFLGTTSIRARILHRLTRNAIQKDAAIRAVTMKLRGETSHEVSATILPNAKQVNSTARFRRSG
jgi:hypothetical protein